MKTILLTQQCDHLMPTGDSPWAKLVAEFSTPLRALAAGLLLAMLLWPASASAQSCCGVPMIVEYQTVSTNLTKTGREGFVNVSPPNVYRKFVDEWTTTISFTGGQIVDYLEVYSNYYTLNYTNDCSGGDCGCSGISPEVLLSCYGHEIDTYQTPHCTNQMTDCATGWERPSCGIGSVPSSDWVGTNWTVDNEYCRLDTYAGYAGSGQQMHKQTLDLLYGTPELITKWHTALTNIAWPADWNSTGQASRELAGNEKCVDGKRMKYRIRYMGPPCEQGELQWVERFTPSVTGGPTLPSKTNTLSVTFTGLEQMTDEYIVEPPEANGTITIEACSGGCSGGLCTFGQGEAGSACGANAAFSLGRVTSEGAELPAFLYLGEKGAPTAALATPMALHVFVPTNLNSDIVDVIYDGNGLRQVKVPAGLADIQIISGGYRIDFYSLYGAKDPVTGLYPLIPYSLVTSWTVQQIAGGAFTLRIAQDSGTPAIFTYQNNAWTGDQGDGLRQRTDTTVTNQFGYTMTNTYVLQSAGGPAVYWEFSENRQLSNQPMPVISRQIIGQGSASLTNRWFYYDDLPTNHVNYGKLKLKVDASGAWERYEYDGANGRLAKLIRTFLNGATNALETDSRVTEYYYTPVHPQDTNNYAADTARTVIEKLKGYIVGRRYVALLRSERWDIQCLSPEATWNDTNNLVTITRTDANSSEVVQRVFYPDGTLQVTKYQTNSPDLTTTVDVGQSDGNPNSPQVTNGTRTVTVSSTVNHRVSSRLVYDLGSNPQVTLANETYVYDNSGRLTNAFNLDGTQTQNHYDCCNLVWSRDKEGIYTTNTYDALKRVLTTTRAGITTSNVYNAAGRVVATWRFGSDAATPPVRLNGTGYDLAGRITTSTNAMNQATFFYYWGLQTVTSYPNGASRSESRNKDGSRSTLLGTALPDYTIFNQGIELEGGIYRPFTKETHGGPSGPWTKTYTDLAARAYKTVYAAPTGQPNPSRQYFFNAQGQIEKEVDPDGVTTLYAYNGRGELQDTAIRLDPANPSSTPDYAHDRITRIVREAGQRDGYDVRRTLTYVWPTDGDDQPVLASVQETTLNKYLSSLSWQTAYGLTTCTRTDFPGDGSRTVCTTNADNSYAVSQFQDGRLLSVNRYDALNNPIGGVTYTYDVFGRQYTVTDARAGTVTTLLYNAADQVVTNRVSATGLADQVTVYGYNNMGWVTVTILPDGASQYKEYYANGLPKKTYGRDYPAEYGYNYWGQKSSMTTWQDFAGGTGAATTTWNYDGYRGFLAAKRYADNTGPDYAYTAAGRLRTNTSARGNPRLTTTYGYTAAGDLATVTYSDITPAISYGYDRQGRLTAITNGSAITLRTYTQAGQFQSETNLSGPLAGLSVSATFDGFLRRTNVSVNSQASALLSFAYGYDGASRLQSLSDGTVAAGYSYIANSGLLANIVYQYDGMDVMSATKAYDGLDRLTAIGYGSVPVASAYAYNLAGQRTGLTNADGSRWAFAYDTLGQVTAGKRYWADGSRVAGQQFEYGFDAIGNRTYTGVGGDGAGLNLRYGYYTANSLNQYTARSVPGAVDVVGTALPEATVTVNDQASLRQGQYFWAAVGVANQTGPVDAGLTNLAVYYDGTRDLTNAVTGHLLVPPAREVFSYDPDGNQTASGLWTNRWDGQNRLVAQETVPALTNGAKCSLVYGYDWLGRRITKTVSNWVAGNWQLALERKFVYDGWNLLAELDGANHLVRGYGWGVDLSGTLQGAGGVGGLLFVTNAQAGASGSYFYGYDGNGNVRALVQADNLSLAAEYEYGPFGEVIRATGPMAQANPFRFSTKYQDDETGLLYYGFRYYNLCTGRWLSRDPFGELGVDSNLYSFLSGNSVNSYDLLGLQTELGPISPDGVVISPGSVEEARHNNYLTFRAKCPSCYQVAFVRIDYGDMCGCLYSKWLSASGNPGPKPLTKGQYCEVLMKGLDGSFGGVRSPLSTDDSNCFGWPVQIQAWMRTRLVSPAFKADVWRLLHNVSSDQDAINCYEQQTKAYHGCVPCSNQS